MKKYAVVLAVLVVLFIFASVVSIFANDIIWDDIGRGNLNLKTVLVNPDNPKSIYLGSENGVFKTEDAGESWRNILSLRGQNKTVNFLLFDPQDGNSLYAVTANGLFFSPDQGRVWQRIFKGKDDLEDNCIALAVLPQTIYLGTKAGLFASRDKGRVWHKESGVLGKSKILAIACCSKDPEFIYVACVDGVFKSSDAGKNWERVFVALATEDGNETEEDGQDSDEEEHVSGIRHLALDPNNSSCLYLATAKGVYESRDKGLSWNLLSTYGLLSQDVRFLLVSQRSDLYAATKSGVFVYKDSRWQELSLGLAAENINFLNMDTQNNLYVACDRGLFKARQEYGNIKHENTAALYSKDEPQISEVQQAAIEYAEVQPQKIEHWRRQAAKKAYLPEVSMGFNRDVSDLWHWEGGSTTKTDDDTLRRGRDSVDWDVTVSWDLGELIWNDDQTSIDVRSRLMVQLRDYILDEVTKLYFERLRVKMEIDNLAIEDRKKRFEKELRLQELTAMLDGLTGGYFSQRMNNMKGD